MEKVTLEEAKEMLVGKYYQFKGRDEERAIFKVIDIVPSKERSGKYNYLIKDKVVSNPCETWSMDEINQVTIDNGRIDFYLEDYNELKGYNTPLWKVLNEV